MKRKYLQLIEHTLPFPHYAIHEALMEDGETFPYWVGSKPIKKYDTYHNAVDAWASMERRSGEVDILHADDIEEITDRVDYSENEEELNFDED